MNVSCPHCGQHIVLSSSQAGQASQCPSCKMEFAAPPLPEALQVAQAEPSRRGSSGLLMTVCSLSIAWALFAMVRGLIYDAFAAVAHNEGYWRGNAVILLNLLVIAGAIVMVCRYYVGLLIYTIAQGLNLAVILYTVSRYTGGDEFWVIFSPISIFIGAFFFLPPAVFLFLAWLPETRKSLDRQAA